MHSFERSAQKKLCYAKVYVICTVFLLLCSILFNIGIIGRHCGVCSEIEGFQHHVECRGAQRPGKDF